VSAILDRFGGAVALVARREVRERMRGRTFRVGTAIILLAVAAAVTIPVLRKGSESRARVGIVGTLSAPLRTTVTAAGPAVGTKVTLVSEGSLASATRALAAGRLALVLVGTKRIVVDQALDPTGTSTTALLVRVIAGSVSLQAGLERAGIAPGTALRLANPPPLPVHSLKPPRHNQTARTTAIYGLILTYVLLTTYGTWLLMGVVEEKSSRVVEVLLSTLRAGQLLGG
jgi:ABC-2 type transport system permease protein